MKTELILLSIAAVGFETYLTLLEEANDRYHAENSLAGSWMALCHLVMASSTAGDHERADFYGTQFAGKEEAMRAREEWEAEARRRREELEREEKRLQERELILDRKFDVIETRDKDLGRRASDLGRKEKTVEERQQVVHKMAHLHGVVADELQVFARFCR